MSIATETTISTWKPEVKQETKDLLQSLTKIGEEDKKKFLNEIKQRYDLQTNIMYAAARLWVDGIIDPADTRQVVSHCIEISNNNPDIPKFNVGVIQT